MDDVPLGLLFGSLVLLIFLSAFFSASETAMMSLNRYRLRHLVRIKHAGALRADRLLKKPDQLIGLILLGNNFVNILAASIATLIALRLGGEAAIAIASFLLTFVILIFAEVTPKTFAALHPEKLAFPFAFILTALLKIFFPIVYVINKITNRLLKWLGVSSQDSTLHQISRDELRVALKDAGAMIPGQHRKMLLNILDMEKVTVNDIMVPRNDIVGIDLTDSWEDINIQLANGHHTRLPIFNDNIDQVLGIIHVRTMLHLMAQGDVNKETLVEHVKQPYYVPEGTSLHTQLLHFQKLKRRIALIVDEYGNIQGMVTLEDILEEIVGEFTSDIATPHTRDIKRQQDGSYLVDGSVTIRELNRLQNWELPTDGPKTLNGLIVEYLESIPEPGVSLRIAGYPIEVIRITGNTIKIARISPHLRLKIKDSDDHQHSQP